MITDCAQYLFMSASHVPKLQVYVSNFMDFIGAYYWDYLNTWMNFLTIIQSNRFLRGTIFDWNSSFRFFYLIEMYRMPPIFVVVPDYNSWVDKIYESNYSIVVVLKCILLLTANLHEREQQSRIALKWVIAIVVISLYFNITVLTFQ